MAVMKKLKLIGYPLKVHKKTAFIKVKINHKSSQFAGFGQLNHFLIEKQHFYVYMYMLGHFSCIILTFHDQLLCLSGHV